MIRFAKSLVCGMKGEEMKHKLVPCESFKMTLRHFAADVRFKAKECGWVHALAFAVVERSRWPDIFACQREYLLVQPLSTLPPPGQPQNQIEFRLATPDDIPLYDQLYRWPSVRHVRANMIERGDVVMLALYDGRLVGQIVASAWKDSRLPPEPDLKLIVEHWPFDVEHDVYSHSMYVARSHRGQGISTPLGLHLMHALRERGFHQNWGSVSAQNTKSLRACRSMGTRCVGCIRVIQLLNWRYVCLQSLDHDPLEAL
jgi:GNAT superfamily N-acetyltransferase